MTLTKPSGELSSVGLILQELLSNPRLNADLPHLTVNAFTADGMLHAMGCLVGIEASRRSSMNKYALTLNQMWSHEISDSICRSCVHTYNVEGESMDEPQRLNRLYTLMLRLEEMQDKLDRLPRVVSEVDQMTRSGKIIEEVLDSLERVEKDSSGHERISIARVKKTIADVLERMRVIATSSDFRETLLKHCANRIVELAAQRQRSSLSEFDDDPDRMAINRRYADELGAYWLTRPQWVMSNITERYNRKPPEQWSSDIGLLSIAWPSPDVVTCWPALAYEFYDKVYTMSLPAHARVLLPSEPTPGVLEIVRTLYAENDTSLERAYESAIAI